ncbi:carboxymuconolactone decarboxylase family protein [Hymenobacter volaticus]|uniref:Carboxymuconolactone decarboxylase family protein n=1 Tax=Hymenobacter volaticus TaxID=2932254 RepID=A0ABY4GGI6_9BACT|nr:carboxymuconolactone decarboxylase family protein [Hymenobacter volaticus]UOQ69956.1 carboxymuconolactone decarboxylase family protein [Hymenobacter volaticus]
MKSVLHLAAAFTLLLASIMTTTAQSTAALTARQQALVTISAYTATGNQVRLHEALAQGLKAGLTVNEEKEVLVHLYAYCGFPRSLSGINTLMKLLDERKAQGIQDVMGKAASPITSTTPKYERGKQNLEQLTGKPETGPKTGANAFSPESDVFLKEHLFADLFERDVLTFQERELATNAALVSLGGVEPMLEFHLGAGLHVGLTAGQLRQLITLSEAAVGKKEVNAARAVLAKTLEAKK